MTANPKLRCAVYTRKSSEEGLEQEFNSLHAQRDACAAFVASQAGLGWRLVPDMYDDGGLSGGTMERPGLQRLLADIAARKVDVVVVYKIDRLTRSLMDFARIVEVFDRHSVSFVSVTQAFNTTTSMGRLTLNVLLSFAQFEREVTAERIRDKIAASKKKGMWMGGRVPLGYRAENRKLIVDEAGAAQVRRIFARYFALRSVPQLAVEMTRERRASNTAAPAVHKGMLYKLLANPLYTGKLRHKGVVHEGEHEGIIDAETYAQVQALLAAQAPRRKGGRCHADLHLLTGLLHDDTGERMSPSHATNHGRRYRYYVSAKLRNAKREAGEGWRVPAGAVEGAAVNQLRAVLSDTATLAGWISEHAVVQAIEAGLARARTAAAELSSPDTPYARTEALLRTAFRAITLGREAIRYDVDTAELARWLTGADAEVGTATALAGVAAADAGVGAASSAEALLAPASALVAISVPARLQRRSSGTRIVVDGPGQQGTHVDRPLVELLARAHAFLRALTSGRAGNTVEVAALFGVHRAEVSRILPLAFLSPQITGAILTGRQPAHLTQRKLARADLPLGWSEQGRALGF